MALTIDQWAAKLKKTVPAWYFQNKKGLAVGVTEAVFYGLAAVFAQADQDRDDQFNATFMTRSTSPVLDLIGDERNIERNAGESDAHYAARIQRITSATDEPDLKTIIDGLLAVPGCKIIQVPFDLPYCSRGLIGNDNFLSRDVYLTDYQQNFFIVIVPLQTHAPYSFCSRDNFNSRLDFVGTTQAASDFFSSIITEVNAQKAFGVLWQLIESSKTTVV